jgi:imidazolonepropionase-like amidohydrolase
MITCTPADDIGPSAGQGCACCQPQLQAAARRISLGLSRRGFVAGVGASLASLGLAARARAQTPGSPAQPIALTHVRLFDGTSDQLRDGLGLLVEGNLIKHIVSGDPPPPEGATIVDCGGRVLMPGLIDAHWHTMFAALPTAALLSADVGYIFLAAGEAAEQTLMRGFTTVRDLGGPSFALKQAIDDGVALGPRIFPSGAMITTTGGHADLRPLQDLPRKPGGSLSFIEELGAANIADSADEVRLRVREQLIHGASQIKLVGGGGVASPRTALDMFTFTEPELRAGVEAAADRNTYATVHAYPPGPIRRAIAAGVRCVEHGHLMDEATAKLMADEGIWLSTQPFVSTEDAPPMAGQSQINLKQVIAGTDTVYGLAKGHKIKTAFGTDLLFSPKIAERQGIMLTHLRRWYEPAEILRMATSINAELLAMSGPRNPYPGRLGVVAEGALADLLVVDGNPLADIDLLARPGDSLKLIMKDGRIVKNALAT